MNDILHFPVITETIDELNQPLQTKDFSRQVFCERIPVRQSEFYSAGQQGIKPSECLKVYDLDYQGEEELKYREKVYHIYRKYGPIDEKTELYCEVRSGAH
jgi:SPP1 family predicted phage head-tail adaptor